jgi:hypothetical protein
MPRDIRHREQEIAELLPHRFAPRWARLRCPCRHRLLQLRDLFLQLCENGLERSPVKPHLSGALLQLHRPRKRR